MMHKMYSIAVVTLVLAVLLATLPHTPEQMAYDIELMKKTLIAGGLYKCCLTDPCSYCLVKDGKCDCLEEVMNGETPCGECVGEILEGEGNRLIAPYFAQALSDKLGEKDAMKRIISEKYGISEEEQV